MKNFENAHFSTLYIFLNCNVFFLLFNFHDRIKSKIPKKNFSLLYYYKVFHT